MAGERNTSGVWLRQVQSLFSLGTAGDLTDADLLDRFGSGQTAESEAAFEALMQRHGPMVLRVCRTVLRDSQDAEDAFQATFLVLAHRASSIRRRDSLSSWLFGVSQRVAAQARLRCARRSTGERRMAERTPEAYVSPEYSEEQGILIEEIDRLPDRLRSAVVLCYLDGLTYEAAARRLGLSETSVRGRLARARDQLRRRLTQRGVSIPATFLAAGAATPTRVMAVIAVSAALYESTIQTVLGFKAGDAVALLASGAMKSMVMSHLRTAAIVFMAGLSTTLLAWQTLAARDDDQKQESAARRAPDPQPATKPRRTESAPLATGSEKKTRTIAVEARDLLTDAPLADIAVDLYVRKVLHSRANTDASGTARFTLPADVEHVFITAKHDGYVPVSVRGGYDALAPIPDQFLLQMEKATKISGRVLDQDQQPIEGAVVVVNPHKRYPKSAQWVASAHDTTKTDASGRWTFSTIPTQPDSIELAAYDYRCLGDQAYFLEREFKAISTLRDGSAVLNLRRGTRIEGTVVDSRGKPISGASVFYGQGRRYGNAIPPLTTDSKGGFTLGIEPGVVSTVAVSHAGFGPAQQTIQIGAEPRKITLQLPPPRKIKGRVVDRAGKPIKDASLTIGWGGPNSSAPSGRGLESIALEVETDADGRFAWNDAPDSGVRAEVSAKGYLGNQTPLSSGTENQVVLTPQMTFHGTVVDSETNQPVHHLKVENAAIWHAGERLIWQGTASPSMDEEAEKAPGTFKYTFIQPAHRYMVRVFADNYLPADTDLFEPSQASYEFTFRLQKADPIRGSVQNADGSPSSDATVYLIPAGNSIDLNNGELLSHDRRGSIHAKVSTDGHFALPPRKDDFLLMALSDAGCSIIDRRNFSAAKTLRLEPWARVTGVIQKGTKPSSELEFYLRRRDDENQATSREVPRVFTNNWARTDTQGRFDLPRLRPGNYAVLRRAPNGINRIAEVELASFEVAAGQSCNLKIGGIGRPVTGRLVLPSGSPWMVRTAALESRNPSSNPLEHGVQVTIADGRFRADNVVPGDYTLKINIHEPPPQDACGWGRLIGQFSRDFHVPFVPGGVSDEPLDLGDIEPASIRTTDLKVGDMAPDFTARTFDGQELKLARFKGKYLLLDFWATWCAPCIAEMPNLQSAHTAFAANPQLEILSLSLDEKLDEAASFIQAQKYTWLQAHAGPDSPVAAAYGASAIPATFLIGPDGKILAKNIRGEQITSTIKSIIKN